ncbi:MAG: ribonuclease HII, partial [Epsilonproteobacteria bacterium]|nr:ribonuclease HII [Campylobacterota bacterium]
KKLSAKKREFLFTQIVENADYEVVFTDNHTIDEIGLSQTIHNAMQTIIKRLNPQHTIMDGNTTFGVENVEAIIKADQSVWEVSAASILAKVSRDRYIVEQATRYPLYQFEKHKGYGTKLHREMIQAHGYCDLHRRSFKIKGI